MDNLSTSIRALTIEAVNWTPWWGGDYTANTITIKDGKVERISLPTVETVKGVTKWVIRAALACHFKEANYKILNKLLAPIYGGTVEDGNSKQHFNSLIRIDVEAEVIDRQKLEQQISQVAMELKNLWRSLDKGVRRDEKNEREIAKKFLRTLECLALSKYGCSKNFFKIDEDCKDMIEKTKLIENSGTSLIRAYGIPRVMLLLLGIDNPEEAVNILPLPPNSVRIRVNVSVNRVFVSKVGDDIVKDLVFLTGLAIVYALEVIGIGKGSSRGFGRFKVISITSSDARFSGEIVSNLKNYAEKVLKPDEAKQNIESLHKELSKKSNVILMAIQRMYPYIKISQGVISHRSTHVNTAPDFSALDSVPCLEQTYVDILTNIKHPFPAPIRRLGGEKPKRLPMPKPVVSDTYEALSAISYATTKTIWKAYTINYIRNAFATKIDINSVSDFSGAGYHTWILGLPRWQNYTGYAIVASDALKSDNACVNKQDMETWKKGKRSPIKIQEGRRKSPIFIYPLPNAKSAIILAFKTFSDHKRIMHNLVHVGKHAEPCRHVVRVDHIASVQSIERGLLQECKRCGDDIPGGIVFPQNIVTASEVNDIIDNVYKAAIEFLKALLT